MGHKLAVNVNWSGVNDREAVFDQARAADEGGVHSIWQAEAWGPDAVPMMTQIAERTKQLQIGSSILNIFSRTPGLFAQTFGTLDIISDGRMIIGLGTSGANVIEDFHGVPFKLPLTRMREYVEIINTLIAGERLNYEGKVFHLRRGFTLRFETLRKHIPIYLASLTPRSVAQAGEIADGWLTIWTPLQDLPSEIKHFRAAAEKAGRNPDDLTVRSPGSITITSRDDVERTRQGVAGAFAFYVARMGTFYYEHISRLGYADEASKIKSAFAEGGAAAGTAAVPPELQQAVGFVTDSVDAALERIAEEEAAGVTLHSVDVRGSSPGEAQKIYERLAS